MRTCIATGETGAPERMIRFVVGPRGRRRARPGAAAAGARACGCRPNGRRSSGPWPRTCSPGRREAAVQAGGRSAGAGRAAAAGAGAGRSQPGAPGRPGGRRLREGRADDRPAPGRAAGRGRRGRRRRAGQAAGRRGLPIARLGDAAALGGIFGREQAVYVAVARDDAGGEFIERIEVGAARWRGYRLNSDRLTGRSGPRTTRRYDGTERSRPSRPSRSPSRPRRARARRRRRERRDAGAPEVQRMDARAR